MTKVQVYDLELKALQTSGTAPNLEINYPGITDYSQLQDRKIILKVHQDCSGPITININGLGVKNLLDKSGNQVNSLKAGDYIEVIYNGTDFSFSKAIDAQQSTSQKVLHLTRTDQGDYDLYKINGVGISEYSEDDFFVVTINSSNYNGVSKINIDGLGEKFIYTPQGDNLKANALQIDNTYLIRYDASLDAFTIMETGNVNTTTQFTENYVDLKAAPTGSTALAVAGYNGGSLNIYDGERYLYINGENDNKVFKWDTWNDSLVATVATGAAPYLDGVILNGYLYVTCNGSNRVDKIDLSTFTDVGNVTVGTEPAGVTTDGTYIYTSTRDGNTYKIDPNTMTVVASLTNSHTRARTPKIINGYLYVNCIVSATDTTGYIDKIDINTFTIVATLTLGGGGIKLLSDNSGYMYCSEAQSDRIEKIDLATFTSVGYSSYIDRPGQIDIKGDYIYAPCRNAGKVYPVNKNTLVVSNAIGTGNAPTSNIVVGNYLYMAGYSDTNIYKIALDRLTPPDNGYYRLRVGTDGKLYLMDSTGNSVVVGTQT